MSAVKSYLDQIKILNEIINEKQQQVQELKLLSTGVKGIDYSAEKIQSSPSDALGNNVVKYMTLEEEINIDIDVYVMKKNKIINQIHELNNIEHIKLLYSKYIELKTFEEIAVEMKYCIRQVYRIHGSALQEFDKMFKEEINIYVNQ